MKKNGNHAQRARSKVVLRRETIAQLTSAQLGQARGGDDDTGTAIDTSLISCAKTGCRVWSDECV